MNPQNYIDAHIDGKIDARAGVPPAPEGSEGCAEGQFYMRGYREEMKRLESPEYCRMCGTPIRVSGLCATGGGSAVSGSGN